MIRTAILVMIGCLSLVQPVNAEPARGDKKVSGPLSFKMNLIDGKEFDLATLKGKVVLFVNVASLCGYTKQYSGLQKIYEKYKEEGLVIVGIPSNEFGGQEPGTNAEIIKFCQTNYKVTFPVTEKVIVKGEGICPLYKFLTSKETNKEFGGEVTWNFEKFLVGTKGEVIGRFESSVDPESDELITAITKALKKDKK